MQRHINILTIWLTIWMAVHSSAVSGLETYGQLKLKIIQDNSQQIWIDFTLTSKDTTINLYLNGYRKTSFYDSIPLGKYKLTLFSELNDKRELQIQIFAKSRYKINVKRYYQLDTSKTTFIHQLTNNDTLKIFVEESGCMHRRYAYCKITRQDSLYFIHYNTKQGEVKHLLTESELNKLNQIETIGRTSKYYYGSTTSAWYWLSVERELIKFRISGSNYISELYSDLTSDQTD